MSIDCTSPLRAWSGQAILRRSPAATPPCGQRSSWRGRDQVDLRSRLVMQLARRPAPTRQVRYGSRVDGGPSRIVRESAAVGGELPFVQLFEGGLVEP